MADAPAEQESVVLQGWARKRGKRSTWRERYFVLKSTKVEYYVRRGDVDPKRSYELAAGCIVSPVTAVVRRGRSPLYEFSIRWPQTGSNGDKSDNAEDDAAATASTFDDESEVDDIETKEEGMHSPAGDAGNQVALQRRSDEPGPSVNPRIAEIAEHHAEAERRIRAQQRHTANPEAEGEEDSPSWRRKKSRAGVSAAAGGSAGLYAASQDHLDRGLFIAFETSQEAEEWRNAVEAQVRWCDGYINSGANSSGSNGLISFGGKLLSITADAPPPAEIKLAHVGTWTHNTNWVLDKVTQGLRVFKDEAAPKNTNLLTRKAAVSVKATPLQAFVALLSMPPDLRRGCVESVRIVETIDDHADVIHMKLRPIDLGPTWTTARDFCLMRYWRLDDDGYYIIVFDSMEHRECPQSEDDDYVRGELHALYTIAPLNPDKTFATPGSPEPSESFVTHVVQVDPKGWMWSTGGFTATFAEVLLLHLIDLRDHLEENRFAAIDVDPLAESVEETKHAHSLSRDLVQTDIDNAAGKRSPKSDAQRRQTDIGLESNPVPFNLDQWSEPDSNTFMVRGPNYLTDRVKISAGQAQFRLLSVDVLEWSSRVPQNISAHPKNRVAMAYRKLTGNDFVPTFTSEPNEPDAEPRQIPADQLPKPESCPEGFPWLFVLHIMIPGPPHLSFAAYFTPVDPEWHQKNTSFAHAAMPFFFGGDDELCDKTFKLIPKIVQGNFVVRRVVGSTPAVLGTKLKQYYHRAPHYFELDVDIGSSSVAAGVVRLSLGYATTITVDMGLVLEGKKERELPEVIMGCVQCASMDLSQATFVQ
uniref:PH domain-containing protein n=1 Tax=Pinguiococcus pyrenoidosus TaxID=172671 RepID=A0A7R9U5S4_9STRA